MNPWTDGGFGEDGYGHGRGSRFGNDPAENRWEPEEDDGHIPFFDANEGVVTFTGAATSTSTTAPLISHALYCIISRHQPSGVPSLLKIDSIKRCWSLLPQKLCSLRRAQHNGK